MRRYLLPIVATAALLGWSRPVQAQTDLDSSMTALCVDATCAQVIFSLDVVGSVVIQTLNLQSLNSTLWRFGGLVSVFSGGTDVTAGWTGAPGGTPTGVTFFADTSFPGSSSPLFFKVNMDPSSTGTQADLVGLITYDGDAHAVPITGLDNLSFGGTVTPEPSTYVMLATGLLGLMVAARRKRAGEFVQGEDA